MDDSFDNALAGLDTSRLITENLSTEPSTSKNSTEENIVTAEEETEPTTGYVGNKSVSNTHCVLVSQKQSGNPLLKLLSNVPWKFDEIVPDYQMGNSICALFLSLKYHTFNPDYIHNRLKTLGKMFELRVLLVLIDTDNPHQPLKYLSRICTLTDLTMMLAWTFEEAAKIIETYKIYESKPADLIKEKNEEYPYLKLVQALTAIKPVNKTDAMTLIAKFGTLKNIIEASEYQLAMCPGFGPRKAKKLYATLNENFCR